MSNGMNKSLRVQFGLINYDNRYLTAETFGFTVNASGTTMKKKQLWSLEQSEQDGQVVFLRSHLGRYLSTDKDGKVYCETEVPDSNCRFLIMAQADGRWAIQSEPYQRYFGGTEDFLTCFGQTIGETELWAVHLALHPQVNLFSIARKRYARLSDSESEITFDSDIPWGVDSLITLLYKEGKYSVKTCDNRFLSSNGKLVNDFDPETAFTLDLTTGKLAFKDNNGKFLAPAGPTGTLKSGRSTKPIKDELFDLEDSNPQVVFKAVNNRYLSIRQGVSISANQDEETDLETFQMEIDQATKKCMFRTNAGTYWTLVVHAGIHTTATEIDPNTMFDIEWFEGRVALKANNGKYVCNRKNGQLAAVSDTIGTDEQFLMKLINRPILILRGVNGFICHHKISNTLDVNRSNYDIFSLLYNDGAYYIKCGSGQFWYVTSSDLVCSDGEEPENFFLEFLEPGKMAIKSKNSKYLRADQGGTLKCDVTTMESCCLWEY
ncbi:fascin-2a [Clarias gariepinus]|uniref:fascin-2a n=1 Tax=Clarias gariepinus TaxID=13013 RepID=UPI00234E265F|nr:fascin-2a [Clarias gariepinus]